MREWTSWAASPNGAMYPPRGATSAARRHRRRARSPASGNSESGWPGTAAREPAEVVGPLAAAAHEVDVGVVERGRAESERSVGTFAPPLFERRSDSFNTRANAASGSRACRPSGVSPSVSSRSCSSRASRPDRGRRCRARGSFIPRLNTLGLPLARSAMPHDPVRIPQVEETLPGVKHFALWPLSSAGESCFRPEEWPASMPKPRSWLEM